MYLGVDDPNDVGVGDSGIFFTNHAIDHTDCNIEAESSCNDAVDDDADGSMNDGCPQEGAFPETGVACSDTVDAPDEDPGAPVVDDDAVVNDGCPINRGVVFPSITRTVGRDEATDHPELPANASIAPDPNGSEPDLCVPHSLVNPRVNAEDECSDSDALADDWDGDGCPDWDELDPAFVSGSDPFNPLDCDNNLNSVVSMLITGNHNAADLGIAGLVSEQPGDGRYVHCLADMQHNKVANTFAMTQVCYSDTVFFPINPYSPALMSQSPPATGSLLESCLVAPAIYCGDGKAGPGPPKPANPNATTFLPIGSRYDGDASESGGAPDGTCHDAVNNDAGSEPAGVKTIDHFDASCRAGPVVISTSTGSVNPSTNMATFAGCFPDHAGAFGPNVYWEGFFNVKTGRGEVDMWFARNNCDTPVDGVPNLWNAPMVVVERSSKINPAPSMVQDSDRDGCEDKVEMTSIDPMAGGVRDPFNPWDFFDPDLNGAVAGPDFFAILGRFGAVGDQTIDPLSPPAPPPAYHTRFDRAESQVPGSAVHVRTAPNGAVAGTDFFAVLGQFGHVCA
jgi:hypothetical protein